MANDNTLLAHLIPRFTSRIEDAATDALAYILKKSEGARKALNDLLREGDFDIEPIVRVRTQVTLEDGSIPDMAGYDEAGKTRLLVESKFWAALQEDQASRYAKNLEQPGPAMLMFIAPDVRRHTLWAEIDRQMAELGDLESITPRQAGVERAMVTWKKPKDTELHLLLTSWGMLLEKMENHTGDADVRSEIRQLRGLARRQDEEAFLPLHGEDLSPGIARRYQDYCRLVDAAVDARGVPEKWMDISRLSATSQRWGYGRYLRFPGADFPFWFGVNHHAWAKRGDTPLWLGLYYNHWNTLDMDEVGRELGAQVLEADWFRWVPVRPKTGAEYDDVLDDVAAQLRRIGEIVCGRPAAFSPSP